MPVTKENAACSCDYKGKTYFCAASCKDDFVSNPDKYLKQWLLSKRRRCLVAAVLCCRPA